MNYKQAVYAKDPVRVHSNEKADIRFYDGALRHAIGAKHYQVVRANREEPSLQEDYGWTYNHAATISYWNNHLFIEYLSNPISEHVPPSQSLLTWSSDGEDWTKPVVVFPQYVLPENIYQGPKKELLKKGDTAIMHQRMGFYITQDQRLFVLGFYGISPECHTSPNNGYGVCRVVREVYQDFTFSPVYVIRYNPFGGFSAQDVEIPFFTESNDQGFVAGCEELLANKLVIKQWWEEQRFDTELFPQSNKAQAFCYYTLDNDQVVGLYKNSLVSISENGGETWGELHRCHSIETSTGKMWGERTSDGNYALVYNPSVDTMHRWPLAVVTGSDGLNFDHLLTLTPYVPPTRYEGWAKNLGPQYVRGICEGFPKPEDDHLWLTYSMNKEDIWVCKVPVPILGNTDQPVDENFNEKSILNWNIYSPKWASVRVCHKNNSLVINDSEPYDKAIATRVFPESLALTVQTAITFTNVAESGMCIDLQDRTGSAAVRINFGSDRNIHIKSNGVYNNICAYELGETYDIVINADCVLHDFSVVMSCNGTEVINKKYRFNAAVASLERLVFQTKDIVNMYTIESNGKDGSMEDLPNSGQQNRESSCYISRVKTSNHT